MEKSIRPYIFVSYAHKDNDTVLPLIEDLKTRGFNVWYDAGIEAGTEWPEYIGTKVFYCNCMIFFLSQNSAVSSNCRREVDFAVALEKSVLTIHLEEDLQKDMSPGLQMTLNNKQAMFYGRSASREMFLENLCKAEILKDCRITEQWDTLYANDDELLPKFEASALSPLKAPEQAKAPDPEKARSDAERAFMQGCKLENEGALEKACAGYESAAKQGHPEAMFRLAECLRSGKGVQKNEKEAYLWYQRAGEHGVTAAMLQQAKLYELTNGTQKGRDKAALLLSIAARLNDTQAMYTLGMLYLQNPQTDDQRKEGVAWLQAAAKREHAQAMYQLGMHYQSVQQEEESLKWLDAAAYWRHPEALYALSQYHKQHGHSDESKKWCILAAQNGSFAAMDQILEDWGFRQTPEEELFATYTACAEKGHLGAMSRLAYAYETGEGTEKNEELSVKWYRDAAYAGERKALYAWAECCFFGKGTEQNYEEAFAFYEKASYTGEPRSVTRLAECYCRGLGTARDEKKAFDMLNGFVDLYGIYPEIHYALSEFYEKGIGTPINPQRAFAQCEDAAQCYYSDAYLRLAHYYETGFGTEEDQAQAANWYQCAAKKDILVAMLEIADRYAVGRGVEQSPEDAYAWYQRAAAKEDLSARLKMAVCMIQGFGTVKNENGGLGELGRLAEGYRYPNAALYMAKFLEEEGIASEALRLYLTAADGGSQEAMEALKKPGYRRMCRFNPVFRMRYAQTKKLYEVNYGQYRPVLIPWEDNFV